MDELISRQAAIDDIWTVSPIAKLDREWIDRWLRLLPSAPLPIDTDGTLWITVIDIERVKRVIVDEEKSKFCKQFYQDAPCEDTVKSHSEKDVLNMCISLLDEMVGHFSEYMEWIGYEPTEEEKECGYFGMTYFHIVQKLFLYHTTHSGGTSTFKKCHELGIDDPSDGVRFPLWKEEEGDAE